MGVTLETSNPSNYFNILPSDSKETAIFIGSTSGNDWPRTLEFDDDYTIRIFLIHSAVHHNETGDYKLTIGITGSITASVGLEGVRVSDTMVEGTRYHTTGQVLAQWGMHPLVR